MESQKMLEQFFQQEEEQILEEIPCGICCIGYEEPEDMENDDFNLLYGNEEFFQCIGYTRAEFAIARNDIRSVVTVKQREELRRQLKEAMEGIGQGIFRNYRICNPRGNEFHVLLAMKMIKMQPEFHVLLIGCMRQDLVLEEKIQQDRQWNRIEESMERLRRTILKLPTGCAVLQGTAQLELVSGNEEFFRTIGYSEEEIQVLPNDFLDAVYREDRRQLKKVMEELLHTEKVGQCDIRICGKNGEIRWIALNIRLFYYQGRTPYFLVSSWDIHRRKRVEEELYLQTERYKLVEDINQEFPFEYDVDSKTIFIAPQSNIMLADRNGEGFFTPANALEDILYCEDYGEFFGMLERASAAEEKGMLEYRVNVADFGESPIFAWHRTIYKSVPGEDGKILRILGRTEDITREKHLQDEIEQRLKQDDLTGLLNKSTTKSEIEGFLKDNVRGNHALFLIDVDNFKMINDTLGHMFGDSVLINVAKKIQELFRATDVVGRIGGDEFMVFMKYTDFYQAKQKAENICKSTKQVYHGRDGEEIQVSCSVGVAVYGTVKESYSSLFSKADMAMYQAKEAGKNQYRVAEGTDPLWKIRKASRIEVRSSQYKAGKMQDMDFLSEAFSLLSHAKDLNDSLNILMERIGRQYDLGRVAVLECDKERKELIQTNCWTRENGILDRPEFVDKYENWDGFLSGFDEWGLASIDDCLGDQQVSEADREVFRERRMRAIVNCSFSYSELGEGFITFCDTEKPRNWTNFEKETFLELSKMLSVFVALRVQREADKKAIRYLKHRDMLTGLYIEEVFKKRVKKELRNWNCELQYAIVYTDINDFSYINENFGHEAGNEILKKFAVRIRSGNNKISCRLYSDLFVTLIWGENKDTILNIVAGANMEFSRQQREIYTSCNLRLSTGIYFIDQQDEDLNIAIENANIARKSIKGSNLFCRVYEPRMRRQREMEKQVLAEFQSNLAEGRFQVYVQPKFLLSRFELFGGEALVRLKKKSGSLEAPAMFIPILEKSGYIVELDFYMYEQVLIYMKRWQNEGKQLPVISVNFSRSHFEKDGIYRRIIELTEKYQVDPQYIEIEITESLFVMGYELVKSEVQLLRTAGFRVAIDDFGTGYSSLGMLLDIPADIVKIDRSFLNRENRRNEEDFIRNMGSLIRSVKEEVIFEGIETEEQREFLVNCGFQYGQGFLFDRPLPIEVFQEKYMK
ncbi:MAG: diguanylate cyclase [Lachnospiraceae bacterium]|nr:diguanylate cyclase [Lachnospiraceae bacterium]